MRRRVTTAILGTAGLALTAGCSLPMADLVAVAKGQDGRAYLITVPCPGHRIDGYEVLEERVDHPGEAFYWGVTRSTSQKPTETVAMFTAPPGWDLLREGAVWRKGSSYSVDVTIVDEDDGELAARSGMSFDAEDVLPLDDDEVLTDTVDDQGELRVHALPREAFRERVLDDC